MTILAILANLAAQMQGAGGAGFALATIGFAAGYSALHGTAHWLWTALGGNAVLLSAAWVVTTIYGGAAGG